MGLYRILLSFFLLPSIVFAESEAETQCRQRYQDILESCDQYSFDNQDVLRLDMDRLSLETDSEINSPFAMEQFYFSGTRCLNSDSYRYLSFVFKQRNSEGQPQCAVWRHYRDTMGQEWVEEIVYQGENQTHLQRLPASEHRNQDRNPALVLDPIGHNSLLNRLGRSVNTALDFIGGGEESSEQGVQSEF